MAFTPQEFSVEFDEDGDPTGAILEGVLQSDGGPGMGQRCSYVLQDADISAINTIVTNARTACGF